MCGIVGFSYQNIQDPKKNISQMVHLLKHRGPDKSGIFCTKGFCSGTSRLAIENIKEGSQPFFDKKNKLVINFNGEIFNYKSLIKKYFNNNIRTEISLLLELFKKKNVNFVNDLEGQFAISIYDINVKKLYLFRDRFGIRPLFYTLKNSNFVFSSEVKSIFSFFKHTFQTSFRSVLNTSMIWTNYSDQCAFEEINQLEPGSYLIYKDNKISKKRYWHNPILNYQNKIEESSFDNKKLNIYNEVERAVKNQIHGEVGYASYLSGGVDSSILSFILTKLNKGPIDTFSVEFENKEYDESTAQNKTKNFINSNHRSIKITKRDIADNFEKTVEHSETHLFRTAPVPMFLLSKMVKESGHKVVFTGEGADEIFMGYDIFAENRIRRFWSKEIKSKFRPMLLKRLYSYLPQFNNPRYFELIKEFYLKNLNDLDNIFYSHLVRWDQFHLIKHFFKEDKCSNHYEETMTNLSKIYNSNLKKTSYDRAAQIIEIETLLSNYLLSSQGDRMSMANGVEGRYPYLDDKLSLAISNISTNKKLKNFKLKNLLRDSFNGMIPDEILNRPKIAYQAPEALAFFSNNKRHYLVDEFLDDLKLNTNFEKSAFENLISKFENENINQRIGFRENTVFINALSDFCLRKKSTDWCKDNVINYKIDKIEYNF